MEKWLAPALDYVPRWLEFQMRMSEQPGCVVAIAHKGRIILEQAFGSADLSKGEPLTPRHRFRIASHSKSFTAAGVMRLRELGKFKLDDTVGQYVGHLNPRIARTTLGQLLSHSAGIVRDGKDAGQFSDRRPFLDSDELLDELKAAPAVEPNTRFKYSNHGFGLIGLAIESVTGEPFTSWIKREIIDAAGLGETNPDMPLPKAAPMRAATAASCSSAGAWRSQGTTPPTPSRRRAASSAPPATWRCSSVSSRPGPAAASFRSRAGAR